MEEIKRIDRKLRYSGAIVDMYTDYMQMPNQKVAEWDYIAHRKGAAAVVPVLDNGNILMVRQYRNAIERYTLEIPAGSRDSVDEPTAVCAARELEEETGYRAGSLELLIKVATTVAFCNEQIDVYVARDLKPAKQHLDDDEFVDVCECTIGELTGKILAGEIQDAKTLGALLAYKEKYLSADA